MERGIRVVRALLVRARMRGWVMGGFASSVDRLGFGRRDWWGESGILIRMGRRSLTRGKRRGFWVLRRWGGSFVPSVENVFVPGRGM